MISKSECVNCGGGIEFELENYQDGLSIDCPHCGQETSLSPPRNTPAQIHPALAVTAKKPKLGPLQWVVVIFAAVVILLGLGLAFSPVSSGAADAGAVVIWLIAVVIMGAIYFLPTIVGRNKRNSTAIMVLNIFLGWTFLGWVVALVWACMKDPESGSGGN